MCKSSISEQRRSRVNVSGVVTPSPVGVAMENDRYPSPPRPSDAMGRAVLDEQRRVHRAAHLGHVANVGRVDDRRVAEAMLVVLGLGDRLVDVRHANDGKERHHLLDGDERVRLVDFAEQQLAVGRDGATHGAASTAASLPMKSLWATSCLCSPSPAVVIACCVRRSISADVEPHGAVSLESGHQLVADAGDAEHFLLGDAKQVVVVRGALDDRAGGVVEVGRFIDDHGRITGAGDDGPFAAVEGRPGDGRAAGDADRRDAAVLEERVGRVERGLGDHANEVVDPQVAVDRLVESPDALGGDALAAGVRVDDHRVAAGDHAHRVAGDRGQRMRDGRDGADDAERGVLDDAQTVVAAETLLRNELDARRALAENA